MSGLTPDANKDLVRHEYEHAWRNADVDRLDESCSPSLVLYGLPTSGKSADLDQFKDFVSSCHDAFPDLDYEIDDLVAEDDTVVARSTFSGTHDGDRFLHAESDGANVSIGSTVSYRIEDGNVAEMWVCFDTLGLLQQLGAVPEHPEAYEWEQIGEHHS